MRYAIVDAAAHNLEARFRGLAAKYLSWEVKRLGGQIVDFPQLADVVLVTTVSPQEWKAVPRALKRAKVTNKQTVVIGGQGAMSPKIFEDFADVICVGEGGNFLTTLVNEGIDAAKAMDNAWIKGEVRPVIPDYDFPYDLPPIKAEDNIVRVFASRGCQKKCLFCQTGWERPYTENDEATLKAKYKAAKRTGLKVNLVTNDAPAISYFDSLEAAEHFSASYSQTREMLRKGVKNIIGKVKSVRLGVEAPSDRLRKYIGKPVDTGDLFDMSCELLNNGIGVRWFMIAGIPGESDEDYNQLREVVTKARHAIKKGALQLSFTAFCPDPAAPLCLAPLDDGYWARYKAFSDWFFDGAGYTRKIQIFKPAMPKNRILHAVGSMAATETELRRGWLHHDPPNWRVKYPLQHVTRKAFAAYCRRVDLDYN